MFSFKTSKKNNESKRNERDGIQSGDNAHYNPFAGVSICRFKAELFAGSEDKYENPAWDQRHESEWAKNKYTCNQAQQP